MHTCLQLFQWQQLNQIGLEAGETLKIKFSIFNSET